MKTKMIYFFSTIVLFAGCDLIKDANTITITTELSADVPVIVTPTGKKSAELTAGVNAIDFTKTQDLTLASNADIEPYLAKIKEINLNSLVVTVTGLGAEQSINTISLSVTGVGTIFTQNNITMANNSFTPEISAAVLDQVAAKLNSEKKITLTLSGNVSGPMTVLISLNFDAEIKATAL